MNEYQGPGVGGLLVRFLALAILTVIVLCIVVSLVKSLWPWLLGFVIMAGVIVVLVRLHGRANTRW